MKICTIEKRKKIGEIGYTPIYTWELHAVIKQDDVRNWCSIRGLSFDSLVNAKNTPDSFEVYSIDFWIV